MKYIYFSILLFILFLFSGVLKAQKISEQPGAYGLERIIVEEYHVADEKDAADTSGGILAKGSVTYRIYVDMKPGYKLQAVYGVPGHDLIFKTTTVFYNNNRGAKTGDQIDDRILNDNSVALDSWLTLGAATKSHFGILKSKDADGSILKINKLDKSDGLMPSKVPAIINYLLDLNFFDNAPNSSLFYANNGSLASFTPVQGSTDDNLVLIAQLTTNGVLSFEINLQIGTPGCTTENYVARNPSGSEIKFEGLIFGK